MTYDPTGHLLLTPVDREAPARVLRLRQLGLGSTRTPRSTPSPPASPR